MIGTKTDRPGRIGTSSLVCAVAIAIAFAALPATAADLATVRVGSATATWQPTVDYAAMALTVSLPDGSSETLRFAAGEAIRFPLSLDGLYTWELVATPKLSDDTLAVLARARATGDNAAVEKLRETGVLPADMTQNGTFDVAGGIAVNADAVEPPAGPASLKDAVIDQDEPGRGQTIATDLIVQGSECVGVDCVSSENFGFDTLRLKENNLRIHFQDTSSSGSFPTNDWRIVANDTSNGGDSYLAIEDSDAGRQVFKVGAGAPANSLIVEGGTGDIGIGTATPVVEVHVVDGDSPALRLEQNGSSGFTPQTWDIAGNETNFFVRDVTNGSKLAFKIKPGAPDNSLFVAANGNLGIGTASPDDRVDIESSTDTNFGFRLSRSAVQWVVQLNQSTDSTAPNGLAFTKVGTGSREMQLKENGDLHILGNYFANGTQLNVPDFVFEPTYDLMSLDHLAEFVITNRHLPNIPPATDIQTAGLNMTDMQMRLLQKIEELTLYTLQQQATIDRLEALNGRVDELEAKQAANQR